MENRTEYLIECSRTAREELLFRLQHRDNWLKLQLYVQAILWAVSNGIKLGGAESVAPIPMSLALALPISFVFTCLYFVEDGLIHYLSKYLADLSVCEKKISKEETIIDCWDNSNQLTKYAKGVTLILRGIAQISGFIILPGYLAFTYHQKYQFECWQIYVLILLFILILTLVIIGYFQRSKTGKKTEK